MINIQGDNKIIMAKKKNKIHLLIDLDGVLTNWEKAAAKICGVDYEDQKIRDELKNGKRIEDFVGGDKKMWPMIDKKGEDWWADLEKFSWTDNLIKLIKKEDKDFTVLTSPANNPFCASGKIKWMRKHFGEDFKDFLIGKKKYLCASSNSLLIDDTEKKCKEFKEYGGNTFLWPHPLFIIDGDKNIDDVLGDLKNEINKLKQNT
jgi:hypothetical protein